MWLAIGVGGLIFRTVHLFFLKDVQTGLVWATKIVTDPFHDIKLYYKAPLYLVRGELIDPRHGQHRRELTMPCRQRDASAASCGAHRHPGAARAGREPEMVLPCEPGAR